ncbi:MAG: pyroglutamyl-peptidase I [Planctomycetota bacterium]
MNPTKPICCLITGFEPFGGSTLNPSQLVIEHLIDAPISLQGVTLQTALLPVDTQRIASEIDRLWRQCEPDIVLHFGESAKASHMTLERIAINLLDFDSPDNAGQCIADQPIDPGGPDARFVTLPVRAVRDQLAQHGIETALSLSAGAYLCNQSLYLSLAHAEKRGGCAVGFVHVPSLQEQVEQGERSKPSMLGDQLVVQAQQLILEVIDHHRASNSVSRH